MQKICKLDGCGRKHSALGYCEAHYRQSREGKELTLVTWEKRPTGVLICSVEGCERVVSKAWKKMLCSPHYNQQLKGREFKAPKKVSPRNKLKLDSDGYAICRDCYQRKLPHFFITRNSVLINICKECENWRLKFRKYNVSKERYLSMLALQGNVCAICKTDKANSQGHSWYIDHDHQCCPGDKSCGNCVRGLVCSSCNHMLGLARDDTSVLRAAIDYLDTYNTTRVQYLRTEPAQEILNPD